MRKCLLVIIWALIIPFAANAQWNFGVEAGAGFNRLRAPHITSSDGVRAGLMVGAVATYTAKFNLYAEAGLAYVTQKGGTASNFPDYHYDNITFCRNKFDYMQALLNIGYKIKLSDSWSLIPKVGGYIAMGLNGSAVFGGIDQNGNAFGVGDHAPFKDMEYTIFGEDHAIPGYKRLDTGLSVGLDLRFKQFALRGVCDFGLMDINHTLSGNGLYNRTYSVTFGYFF
jgi:hypothetical protein